MSRTSNVIPVRKIPQEGFAYAKSHVYKLHSQRKFPSLIYRVPGCGLCFDFDEWQAMCEKAKAKSVAEAERVHRSFKD